jgi:hypothetical protein
MRLRLMLPLALFALLFACSGDDDTDRQNGTATPAESTLAPAGVSTPGASITAQALGLRTQAVKWVDAEAYDPKTIIEVPGPAWDNNQRLPLTPGTDPAWSVFAVRPDSPPQPLYNTTKRWLRNATWDKDGVAVQFTSRRDVMLSGSGDKATLDWQGKLTIDPSTGAVREDVEALPTTSGNDAPGRQLDDKSKTVSVQRDLAGTQAVLTVGIGYGPFRRIETVYMLDKQGKAKRLEGIKDLRSLGWLPSGGALTAFIAPPAGQPFRPTNEAYIIPASDGQAIYVGETPIGAEGLNSAAPAKGSRLLILVPDPNGAAPSDSLMVLYDTRKHDLRILGKGPSVLRPNPAGFPAQIPITWPDGSNEFAIGIGIDAVIVNATTGAMRPGQPQELLQSSPPSEARSPNGRFSAGVEAAPNFAFSDDCRGRPYRLTVTDTQTGSTRPLLECHGGFGGQVKWIDETRLILTVYNCYACEPSSAALTLVDVVSGNAKTLTAGLEPNATATPSPDHSRLLVTGNSLRVYDSTGSLQRDLGPAPEGLKHTSLAWAPDSRSFAYILGPL